jgi:hypothetical protein
MSGFLPAARTVRVDIKSLYGIGVRLYVDGLSGFVYADADRALEEVSTTARMPGWWPAASVSSRVLIETEDAREVTRRIEAFAIRGPKPFGGR